MAIYARPAKRSLTLCGHRTSVTLEDPFWAQFQVLAGQLGISVNALASRVDASRPSGVGLASAIRVFVLRETLITAGSPVPRPQDDQPVLHNASDVDPAAVVQINAA